MARTVLVRTLAAGLLFAAPAAAAVNRWTPTGPPGGTVPALAGAPSDPAVVYAGTGAGVYRSLDGGRSWRPVGGGPGSPLVGRAVGALAVHPRNPGAVYAGAFGGLFRSLDGGATWSLLPASVDEVVALAIDPRRPAVVYACEVVIPRDDPPRRFGGCLKSEDEGESWRRVLAAIDARGLALAPTVPPSLFASGRVPGADGGPAASDERGVLLRSTDGGESWQDVATAGGPLTVSPHDPRHLLAGHPDGVTVSTDGGATWTPAALGPPTPDVQALLVDPRRPQVAYAAPRAGGLFRSDDGGLTWRPDGLAGRPLLSLLPVGAALLAGTAAEGVLRRAAEAAPWLDSSAGMTAQTVQALAFDLEAPGTVYLGAGMQFARGPGAAVFKSVDGARTWVRVLDRFVRSLAVDPTASGTVYAAAPGDDLLKSTDGGASWQALGLGSVEVVATVAFPGTVYAVAAFNRLLRSTDGGLTWTDVGAGLAGGIRTLVADLASPGALFAVTEAGIFRTADGGASWQLLSATLPAPVVFDLAVDPRDSRRLFAATSLGLFRSTDGGGRWRGVAGVGRCGVQKVAIDPHDGGRLAVVQIPCVGPSVAVSLDGGATWQPLIAGLTAFVNSTATNVALAVFDPFTEGSLFAATFEGGFHALELVPGVGACEEAPEVLCIDGRPGDRRFRITAAFATVLGGGRVGDARATSLAPVGIRRGGILTFFNPENPEVLVKILDGCPVNGHRWVFASAGTTAGFSLRVEDTLAGVTRTYRNPDTTAAPPLADTFALATCTP